MPYTASLLLVANTTRLLIAQWLPAPQITALPMRSSRSPAVAGSVTVQSGLVALLWGYPLLAAAFFAAGAAMLTTFAIVTGAYRSAKPPVLPQSLFSVALTVLLALGLTVGVFRGFGPGPDSRPGPASNLPSARELLQRIVYAPAATEAAEEPPPPAPAAMPLKVIFRA